MTQTILDLKNKYQALLAHQIDLDEARSIIMRRGKTGMHPDEVNAKLDPIIAEQKTVSSELVELQISIAEMQALIPIELKSADLRDIVSLFEYALNNRTPPPAIVAALGRLNNLMKGPAL